MSVAMPVLAVSGSGATIPLAADTLRADERPFPIHELLEGDFDTLSDWKAAGGDINITLDASGWTPMCIASALGNEAAVRILFELGARANDIDASAPAKPGKRSFSALHAAVRFGHLSVVELFAKLGEDVNCRDQHGFTALHYAAANGWLDVCTFLLNNGADALAKTSKGTLALELAKSENHRDIELLLRVRLGVLTDPRSTGVARWLDAVGLSEYYQGFLSAGYDDISFIKKYGLDDGDLDAIGVKKLGHRKRLKMSYMLIQDDEDGDEAEDESEATESTDEAEDSDEAGSDDDEEGSSEGDDESSDED